MWLCTCTANCWLTFNMESSTSHCASWSTVEEKQDIEECEKARCTAETAEQQEEWLNKQEEQKRARHAATCETPTLWEQHKWLRGNSMDDSVGAARMTPLERCDSIHMRGWWEGSNAVWPPHDVATYDLAHTSHEVTIPLGSKLPSW